jgi:hypothetical protein
MTITEYKTNNYTIFERRKRNYSSNLSLNLSPRVEERFEPHKTTVVENLEGFDRVEYSRLAKSKVYGEF